MVKIRGQKAACGPEGPTPRREVRKPEDYKQKVKKTTKGLSDELYSLPLLGFVLLNPIFRVDSWLSRANNR